MWLKVLIRNRSLLVFWRCVCSRCVCVCPHSRCVCLPFTILVMPFFFSFQAEGKWVSQKNVCTSFHPVVFQEASTFSWTLNMAYTTALSSWSSPSTQTHTHTHTAQQNNSFLPAPPHGKQPQGVLKLTQNSLTWTAVPPCLSELADQACIACLCNFLF